MKSFLRRNAAYLAVLLALFLLVTVLLVILSAGPPQSAFTYLVR